MSSNRWSRDFWTCADCGKPVSQKPRNRDNLKRRVNPPGWDHLYCSGGVPLDITKADQRDLRRLAILRDEQLG